MIFGSSASSEVVGIEKNGKAASGWIIGVRIKEPSMHVKTWRAWRAGEPWRAWRAGETWRDWRAWRAVVSSLD